MDEIIKLLKKDIADCRVNDGNCVNNTDDVTYALATLETLIEAINYTRCCESVKDKHTHTFEVDLNSDRLKEQHCEQMKQIHNAPTRLFMYDPKTEKYIELKP